MRLASRTWILLGLVLATAASAALQYVSQGLLATGHTAAMFSDWFWTWEGVLWGLRAIVEAALIAFLFSTKAQDKAQGRVLAMFEAALIVLIAVTLGPAMASMGYGAAMKDILPTWAFWCWNFAIASYAPLMMGAAGFAYKVGLEEKKGVVEGEKSEVKTGKQERWDRIANLIAGQGTTPYSQRKLASDLQVDEAVVSRDVKAMVKEGILARNNSHLEVA